MSALRHPRYAAGAPEAWGQAALPHSLNRKVGMSAPRHPRYAAGASEA